MTNSEVLRKLEHKMDEDTHFANNMKRAIETENDYWLSELYNLKFGNPAICSDKHD
ncbi:MAG: hypothetical protein QM487_01745 [Candidatus Marithrix sp.]